jgi:hypothetical protein
MSPADLIFYPPICLAVCFVWAGTRETGPGAVAKHALVLAAKLTVGLVVLGVALQGLLAIVG